ncbi:MAG TPA: hypothetical protein VG406_27550 [Isosphaeraceae bacterium]|jgi:hypothetical protein|nr:hypothetical protein [Isosphaeraceae bacterium]
MASVVREARKGTKRGPSVREVCLVSAAGATQGDRLVVGGRVYEVVGAPGAYLHLRPAGQGSGSGDGR